MAGPAKKHFFPLLQLKGLRSGAKFQPGVEYAFKLLGADLNQNMAEQQPGVLKIWKTATAFNNTAKLG